MMSETKSGNSSDAVHAPVPDVDQAKLIRVIFDQVGHAASSMGSMRHGGAFPFRIFLGDVVVFFEAHLTEHPNGLVMGTGTGFPASKATTALRASKTLDG